MERIDLQDSVYRTQPAEKLQARQQAHPEEDQRFQLAKQAEKDEVKETQAQESEAARDKLVDEDGRGPGDDRKKRAPKKPAAPPNPTKKKPSIGNHLIDLEV